MNYNDAFLTEDKPVFRRVCGAAAKLQASGWVLFDILEPPLLGDVLLIPVVRCRLQHIIALHHLWAFIQHVCFVARILDEHHSPGYASLANKASIS